MTDERNPPFNPELADDRLAAWVDGELTGKDLERFEAELRVNKRLREQAESYRAFVQSMQGALQQPLGTVNVTDRVIAALQRPVLLATRRSMVLPWLLSAAVAAGLLTAVWLMQRTSTPEVLESAKAPESSKEASTENEKKHMAEGAIDEERLRADGDRRKQDVGELDKEAAAKPGADPGAAKVGAELGDIAVLTAKEQSQRMEQKEESKQKSSDDFWLGGKREGGPPADVDKAKKSESATVADNRPGGAPAPTLKSAGPEQAPASRPEPETAAAGEKQFKDHVSQSTRDLEAMSKLQAGFMEQALAPSVQVVVLTRHGTPEELRRNLTPRESNEAERSREGRNVQAAIEAQLSLQFPSIVQPESYQMRASRLQQTANGQALNLYSLGIDNVQRVQFGSIDQGRTFAGNRLPEGYLGRYQQEMERLVPEGTRANAVYVEGELARVQDFLNQVGTWASYNDVAMRTDELPAAQVEYLKLAQLQNQAPQANVPAQVGGGGGKAGAPAGPVTPGRAGPATQGPAGPTTGGPPATAPKGQPERKPGEPAPQPAPTKAVLLLFREQGPLPQNKR